MNSETQAMRLSKMMQEQHHTQSYELVLSWLYVDKKRLKSLNANDVILTDMSRMEALLMKEDTVCAHIVFKQKGNRVKAELVQVPQEPFYQPLNKEYAKIKLWCGTLWLKNIQEGELPDGASFDLERIAMMYKNKTIATGVLVNVNHQIAIKIDKVLI